MNVENAELIVKDLWEKDVSAWNTHWVPIFRKFSQELIYRAQLRPGQIILDIGTGTGVTAFEAEKRIKNGFVIGVDRSPKMISVARANKTNHNRNIFFIEMTGERLLFPSRLFARVVSNCGISPGTFRATSEEISRVLRDNGIFASSEFHLIDVNPHRTFSEVLRRYRTDNPSRKLRRWREALATMESLGNQGSDSKREMLRRAGFKRISEFPKIFRIILPSTQYYLKMRFQRIALRQELIELPQVRRRKLLIELRNSLETYTHNGQFSFNWKVNFTLAKKQ